MRKTSRVVLVAAAALCGAAFAENQNLESGSATYGPGIKVQYVTVAEPRSAVHKDFSGGFGFDGNLLHRWMLDQSAKSYFGYDLLVEPIAGTTRCRVSILPLSVGLEKINSHERRVLIDASWKPLQLPSYPPPQIVEPGETIALDLLASPDGSQKVVDYLRASCQKQAAQASVENAPARDFRMEDIALNITDASLYLNGEPVSGVPTTGDAQGAVTWFYFPGKGRFLVSILPHPGFEKAGVIRDRIITFDLAGDHYKVNANHPVFLGRGAWNAYVMRDAAYPVTGANAAFGGADTVEAALAQK